MDGQKYADYGVCEVFSGSSITVSEQSCYRFNSKKSPYAVTLTHGHYLIVLAGASGGYSTYQENIQYGLGGISIGHINIVYKRTFYLFVGGRGADSSGNTPGSGGYNGGAAGGKVYGSENDCASGGSGGATDIRLENYNDDWENEQSLISRVIVAGGGGSGGCWTLSGVGGDGGGLVGKDGDNSTHTTKSIGGKGGNQENGFRLGVGENGKDSTTGPDPNGEASGSGGGGYWGGFSGQTGYNSCGSGGGGGGSSYISGHSGCISVDRDGKPTNSNKHFSGITFFDTITMTGKNNGDGYAYIIWVSNPLLRNKTCKNYNQFYKLTFLIYFILIKI